jgi:hypothetical protein
LKKSILNIFTLNKSWKSGEKVEGGFEKWTKINVHFYFSQLEICKRGGVAASSGWEGWEGSQVTA